MASDRDIDKLYQLPLGDFTGARNTLAKAAGKSGAAIKGLEKPTAAAWAVNQLYWTERRAYDKLIRASERVRAGHSQVLKGKKIDLRALETQHGAAVKDAAEEVRAILNRAGDPATPATMKSVVDTLQALPGGSDPGRLTKALAPIGFGAFGALMKGAVSPKALAEVVTFAPPKPKPDEVAAAAKQLEAAKEKRLRELEAEAKMASQALAAARAKFDRAEKVRAAAEASYQKTVDEAKRLAADVARLERDARAADQERARLAADLG
jgi:hypothetical protein